MPRFAVPASSFFTPLLSAFLHPLTFKPFISNPFTSHPLTFINASILNQFSPISSPSPHGRACAGRGRGRRAARPRAVPALSPRTRVPAPAPPPPGPSARPPAAILRGAAAGPSAGGAGAARAARAAQGSRGRPGGREEPGRAAAAPWRMKCPRPCEWGGGETAYCSRLRGEGRPGVASRTGPLRAPPRTLSLPQCCGSDPRPGLRGSRPPPAARGARLPRYSCPFPVPSAGHRRPALRTGRYPGPPAHIWRDRDVWKLCVPSPVHPSSHL